MKVYIAYKHAGEDEAKLRRLLEDIATVIEKQGHETFIFYRDVQQWGKVILTSEEIIKRTFAQIEQSDVVFAFVGCTEKSEGMLIEVTYAKAKGKKVVLAINSEFPKDTLRFVRAFADKVIEYTDFMNLETSIEPVLVSLNQPF